MQKHVYSSFLSKLMRHPRLLTSRWVMASPSPEPPSFVVTQGFQMLSRSASGTPGPES